MLIQVNEIPSRTTLTAKPAWYEPDLREFVRTGMGRAKVVQDGVECDTKWADRTATSMKAYVKRKGMPIDVFKRKGCVYIERRSAR